LYRLLSAEACLSLERRERWWERSRASGAVPVMVVGANAAAESMAARIGRGAGGKREEGRLGGDDSEAGRA
jgi:hypothetical protein